MSFKALLIAALGITEQSGISLLNDAPGSRALIPTLSAEEQAEKIRLAELKRERKRKRNLTGNGK